jgi:hypothetical protein
MAARKSNYNYYKSNQGIDQESRQISCHQASGAHPDAWNVHEIREARKLKNTTI